MKNLFSFTVMLLVLSWSATAQSLEKKIKEFDSYVESSRVLFQVPGMAVAVVKDGKVIFKKGYGARSIESPGAVDTQTLFSCGSTTKAMTAACMGMLVDDGKVSWDDPVSRYLPDFQLNDPYVTRELKIRDLFTHNSGVGNTDFLWSLMNIPGDEVLEKMRLVKPSYSFRSSFIYQNIFYLVAGKVIEKVSGMAWEDFVQHRIFRPLGMTRTFPTLKMVNDPNQSIPHYQIAERITTIERLSADNIGPAGSVWSSIDDMSKWAICMLDTSRYAGGRLLKAKTWLEIFKPQVIVPSSQFYPMASLTKPNWMTYGLGWFQQDYKGKKINFHTGSLPGETAILGLLPDSNLAICVFGNYDHAEVRHALMFKAFDLFALGGTRDWSKDVHSLYSDLMKTADAKEKEFEASRIPNTKPTLQLDDYTGKYTDPLYGELIITCDKDEFDILINQTVKARVSHWHYNTFRGLNEKWKFVKVTVNFSLAPAGKVSTVDFNGIVFKKEN